MLVDVVNAAKSFMLEELGLTGSVIGVERSGDGWVAMVEAITPDPEMRALAKRDLVATFEIVFDTHCRVISFTRTAMRERGTVAPPS